MKRIHVTVGLLVIALGALAQSGASNIEFVENKGQWDPRVHFKGELPNGALFLEKTGFTVLLYNGDDLMAMTSLHHGVKAGTGSYRGGSSATANAPGGLPGKPDMLRGHTYRVSFEDADPGVEILPDKALPGYNNYLIGPDTTKWGRNCKVFQGVTYRNIYPNIDVRYYTNNGQLKYDIIVHPGGDLSRVRMQYTGADKLSTHKGKLLIGTSVGTVTQLAPVSYLSNEAGRTDIRCRPSIHNGNVVSFDVPDHDPNATLVIDPVIIFCSFTGSKVSNWGFTATPGPDGSFFAGGIVFGSAFPYTTGAIQPTYGGGQFDVGIIKLNSSGSSKVFATYLGGTDSETPHSLICDGSGELVVLGRTYSGPTFTRSVLIGPGGNADMFVIKMNAAGNGLIGGV
ncbi:MAG TPA: hypothetical protein VHE54_14700, partial [Puia sp.]|nr:hypothetical protein [Puia sp.]